VRQDATRPLLPSRGQRPVQLVRHQSVLSLPDIRHTIALGRLKWSMIRTISAERASREYSERSLGLELPATVSNAAHLRSVPVSRVVRATDSHLPCVITSLIRSNNKVALCGKVLDLTMPRQKRCFREAVKEDHQSSIAVAGFEYIQSTDRLLQQQ
jgi:hypothetical protein